jgi:hypothetical protein
MNLRYIIPAARTTNFGDYIIHFAIECLLERFVGPPVARIDLETEELPKSGVDCLLVPGITHLTSGERPALERVGSLPYPAYCLSGCIWTREINHGYLLRTRVVHLHKPVPPDLRVARLMAAPIGARDPYTYALLRQAGLQTLYTGCATLMLAADGVADDGYLLFSLGRGHVRRQVRAAKALSAHHSVVGICHEIGDVERYRAAGWELPLVTWQGDVALYLSYFKRAQAIVTGRLHGVLPGLAYGKKVFYFGTRDSRTSILDDLGVRTHGWDELAGAVKSASSSFNRSLLDFYEQNWKTLLQRIACDRAPVPGSARGILPPGRSHFESTADPSCVHA